tara:strand:+ start:315 stop:1175 length:861 start_codon:yes stop_codon:yes gene_type:complete
MIKIGSLFSGIGGFEKGIEDALGGMAETVWQVEQNSFCQRVLKKHWPNATIFDDVRTAGKHNLEPVDILCGGWPCQSISTAGNMEGLENENKSGLWWEMHRIISDLRDTTRVILLENVANVLRLGGPDVIGSLAAIGYDCEWKIIRASDFGAPHHRARWFCVAYPHSYRTKIQIEGKQPIFKQSGSQGPEKITAYPHSQRGKKQPFYTQSVDQEQSKCGCSQTDRSRLYNWKGFPAQSPVCRRDDGVPHRVDRIKALGNAIVPQCSEWVALQVLNSGLLDDLLEAK